MSLARTQARRLNSPPLLAAALRLLGRKEHHQRLLVPEPQDPCHLLLDHQWDRGLHHLLLGILTLRRCKQDFLIHTLPPPSAAEHYFQLNSVELNSGAEFAVLVQQLITKTCDSGVTYGHEMMHIRSHLRLCLRALVLSFLSEFSFFQYIPHGVLRGVNLGRVLFSVHRPILMACVLLLLLSILGGKSHIHGASDGVRILSSEFGIMGGEL